MKSITLAQVEQLHEVLQLAYNQLENYSIVLKQHNLNDSLENVNSLCTDIKQQLNLLENGN